MAEEMPSSGGAVEHPYGTEGNGLRLALSKGEDEFLQLTDFCVAENKILRHLVRPNSRSAGEE